MQIILSTPSKTFLIGEYAVLNEAPGIILNTSPRFILKAENSHRAELIGIDSASPTGRFIQDHLHFFQDYTLEFCDPFNKAGGFGASSALFLMSYALYQKKYLKKEIETNQLLETYLQYAWDGKGIPPSGVDLLAQWKGKISFISGDKQTISQHTWPFADVDFMLLRTGNKIPTYQHLQEINHISKELTSIAHQASQFFLEKNAVSFFNSINEYAIQLAKENLTLKNTESFLSQLKTIPGILAAKGCGALGADVVLIIFEKKYLEEILCCCHASEGWHPEELTGSRGPFLPSPLRQPKSSGLRAVGRRWMPAFAGMTSIFPVATQTNISHGLEITVTAKAVHYVT